MNTLKTYYSAFLHFNKVKSGNYSGDHSVFTYVKIWTNIKNIVVFTSTTEKMPHMVTFYIAVAYLLSSMASIDYLNQYT